MDPVELNLACNETMARLDSHDIANYVSTSKEEEVSVIHEMHPFGG